MKKIKLLSFFVLSHLLFMKSQTPVNEDKSVAERLRIIQKKMDNFGIFVNFRTNFYIPIEKNLWKDYYFSVDQLRLEMMGNLNDKVSYRFRQRLNKSADPGATSTDKVSRATDFAFIEYKINDKVVLTAGKQAMAIGTIESNYNALVVYQYADIFQNVDIFYTGVNFTYRPIKKHQFQFQVLNNSIDRLSSMYDKVGDENTKKQKLEAQGIKEAKTPLGYTFNWSALWEDEKIHARSSYSLFQEAKNKYWKILALGAQFNFHPLIVDADYIHGDEDIDREQYGTVAFRKALDKNKGLDGNSDKIATNVLYNSYILKLKYQFSPHWNAFIKGMYETAYSADCLTSNISNKNFRKSYGYLFGVEYFPFKDINSLRLYLLYRGQQIKYAEPIKDLNRNINAFSLGLSYRIKMF
ncbi:porin [Bacteroidetes bacterium endosymbiont of Geopemphigus sp.]|uniref:porin n=1 Tax=Bacteroidetes bacterium endosymbiont of Geopemphigus sp. TaxID=2047937 RepID=UPI000CD217A6|nr:porin [Bacteroidetes bacterium endosymbiont of Geopemphigus sp.]